MFFRNLTFFRFPYQLTSLFPLQDAMAECALKPVGPLELASYGFISPYARDDDRLLMTIGQCQWLAVGGEERILPAAAVNELLAKKVEEIEEREGRKLGGRARKRLKDDLLHEMIPRAFVKPVRTDAYMDLDRGFIAVDTSSRRTGEGIVSQVRRAAGSFPALPLNAEVAPRSVLTGWLAGEPLPEGWSLGEECELRDVLDGGAVAKFQNTDLNSEEVHNHLASGMQCTRLEVLINESISCVIGEDLILRRLRFLDGAIDKLEDTEREDLAAEYEARFALMSGEIGQLFDTLEQVFHLSRLDEGHIAPAPAESGGAVTISAVEDGVVTESVTMTGDEFSGAAGAFQKYQQALEIVREKGNCTISHLQRRLKIGYNAAARLIEVMEERGVVTAPDSSGHRHLTSGGKA